MLQRIDGGFDADDGLDVRRRGCFGIRERPFQDAVDDQVGIAANGRSEVGVFVEAKSEVAFGFGGIASLLEGTKHQAREDPLLGFAGELLYVALIAFGGAVYV